MRLGALGHAGLVGLVAALVLTGCSGSGGQSSSTASSKMKTDLLIGQYPGADSAPLFIAMERGFFKEEGLNVRQEPIQAPQQVLGKLSNGTMDIVLGSYATILTIQEAGTEKFTYIADAYQGATGA